MAFGKDGAPREVKLYDGYCFEDSDTFTKKITILHEGSLWMAQLRAPR